jgi:hypothetical protein
MTGESESETPHRLCPAEIREESDRSIRPALLALVLCAVFLTMTIVLNVKPYRTVALFGNAFAIHYPSTCW